MPEAEGPGPATGLPGPAVSFRVLLTIGLVAAGILPIALFGGVLMIAGLDTQPRIVLPFLVASTVAGALFGLLVAALTVARLTAPLRRITSAVERVAAGEPGPALPVTGDDELARLAESHNRIAGEVQRRNRELGRLLEAVAGYGPADGVEALRARAQQDACSIYGLIDCQLRLVDPSSVPEEERIPGDPRPVRAQLRAGGETLGVLTGHLPATRSWERADQDLLDLFANEVGVALRNAELFGQIEKQNARLVELDAAKDEFLRGVSHNLQTPLTSIRAYVDQMRSSNRAAAGAAPAAAAAGTDGAEVVPTATATAGSEAAANDRRLDIVAEQTDRLTRLVRQLLTVTRLEAGVLRAQPEVMAVAPRVRRVWEVLNVEGAEFSLRNRARGWLAVADADQLDQILWALLDNAVKYGGPDGRVEVSISAVLSARRLEITITDSGPGIATEDRERLFTRFSRGATQGSGEGTGLGLYVSRQLARAMDGDLRLEPARAGVGAAFTIVLPGEPAEAE
jgi:signal transduction histidine kinase/HAMP domain-containing protein